MNHAILIQNISLEELEDMISNILDSKLRGAHSQTTCNDNYLTRKEAASLLRISLTTLSEYTKHGTIPGHRIGNRVLYRRDEINDGIRKIEIIKHKRA